jgi:hypothetical protein
MGRNPSLCINRCTQLILLWSDQVQSLQFKDHKEQPEEKREQNAYASCIRLLWCQPPWLKISCATVCRRVDPESMCACCASGSRKDHSWIQWVAIRVTCRKWGVLFFLLKIISFLQFHKDHTIAQIPTQICAFVSLSIPFKQFLNIFVQLVSGTILKVKWTTL